MPESWPDFWGLISIIAKFLLYVGVLGSTGMVTVRLVFRDHVAAIEQELRRQTCWLGLLALVATVLGFALQGALLIGNGWGMVDAEMLGLLWTTPVGDAFATRLAGLVLLLVGLGLSGPGPVLAALGGAIALWSFTQIGHVPDQETRWMRVVLMLHLLGIAFWIGILSPLNMLTKRPEHRDIAARLGHRFGQIAGVVVPGLILAGIVMAWRLVGSFEALLGTGYGQALLLKTALIGGLLALAAMNKLRFVPALLAGEEDAAARLSRSIGLEWIAILSILMVTAMLTSLLTLPM